MSVPDQVVVGAGVGGLALGIALRRRGVPATVVERAEKFGEVGSGVVLAPNGMKALHTRSALRSAPTYEQPGTSRARSARMGAFGVHRWWKRAATAWATSAGASSTK